MKFIDVSTLLNNEDMHIELDDDIDIDFIELSGSMFYFKSCPHIKGEIRNVGDALSLIATVSGEMSCQCDRCAGDIMSSISFDFTELLAKAGSLQLNYDDVIVISGNSVDISEIAANNIINSISMKNVCSAECKGICPNCGINLNEATCDCVKKEIDPRLFALKKLLEQ